MAAKKVVIVHNRLQDGYTYEITEPVGKNFAINFTPDLSPKEMLELGVFGGTYLQGFEDEFPPEWFYKAKITALDSDDSLNYFGIHASQSLEEWQRRGWIYDDDPLGWFLWYCRYYMGRRCSDDERQIKRWKSMNRHVSQVRSHCQQGDELCRPKQRQALLHWSYDSRLI